MLSKPVQDTFIGYESLLEHIKLPLYLSQLIKEDDLEVLRSFLETYEFTDGRPLFDDFRFHFSCFKAVYHNNDFPFRL
ncbi:hypothetical protein [Bacillus sp. 1P06AnD]|uniref:hypothetical protein n=1 Tax=Bacillus sp. 1P06AnD TaxID=3132208 RepID=UPI0039A1CB35